MGRFDSEYFTKVKTSDLFGVPLGVIPSEFCQTIVPGLLCGIVCMILAPLKLRPAPLKLRPYGAIQMCILLLLLLS